MSKASIILSLAFSDLWKAKRFGMRESTGMLLISLPIILSKISTTSADNSVQAL
jgi:hypothetical protein